jgi:alkylated DNA nucleotide flippase Atl1
MASARADEVAEILWELKRAGKVASYTEIARRAGFSAGSNGRAMDSCLKVIRRDWPHLQWWRAIKDDGVLENEQESLLRDAGFEMEQAHGGKHFTLMGAKDYAMAWSNPTAPVAQPAAE